MGGILPCTQAASMLLAGTLAALTLSGVVREGHVFTLAALLGVVNAFDIPARQSFVVDMAGKEDLINAIALNSSMFNGARIVGPAIAGLLVVAVGEGWCFFANSVSYIAVLGGLLMMRAEPVYSMIFMGMAPTTVALGGTACILGTAVFWLRLPLYRGEAQRLIVAQQMTGGSPPEEIIDTPESAQAAEARP
jgi:MFS family permease